MMYAIKTVYCTWPITIPTRCSSWRLIQTQQLCHDGNQKSNSRQWQNCQGQISEQYVTIVLRSEKCVRDVKISGGKDNKSRNRMLDKTLNLTSGTWYKWQPSRRIVARTAPEMCVRHLLRNECLRYTWYVYVESKQNFYRRGAITSWGRNQPSWRIRTYHSLSIFSGTKHLPNWKLNSSPWGSPASISTMLYDLAIIAFNSVLLYLLNNKWKS